MVEIHVLRDNRETAFPGVGPDGSTIRSGQLDLVDVDRPRKLVRKRGHEVRGDVLVGMELHPGGIETSLRSRAAANASTARMSSGSRSRRSDRISVSVIPEARYSSTSYTVIRSPRMHGFPALLPGSSVMRSNRSMLQDTRNPDGRSEFAEIRIRRIAHPASAVRRLINSRGNSNCVPRSTSGRRELHSLSTDRIIYARAVSSGGMRR